MAKTDQVISDFRNELEHHLDGLVEKVIADFGVKNFDKEIGELSSDPVYSRFHLNRPEYVLIRLMGRMSVSIGRRLGEIYDKIPRLAAQSRFGLAREKVVQRFDGLELDICLQLKQIRDEADRQHILSVAKKHLNGSLDGLAGLGIEIRYNFNPNDSSRLRKDKHFGDVISREGLLPIYLVFAENSPRLNDAVASIERSGWEFLIGQSALDFLDELVGLSISNLLLEPEISALVAQRTEDLFRAINQSHAWKSSMNFDK